MKNESLIKFLDEVIASVFTSSLKEDEECEVYEGPRSISEYTESTGKRFRMTKEQKQRGLNRDDAFRESMINSYGNVDF